MEAVSSIFGGILKLWAYAVFVVLPLVALGYACVYFVKHPKESIGVLFWTIFPYLLAGLLFFLLKPFIDFWAIVPAAYAWLKAQSYSVDIEQRETKTRNNLENHSKE